MSEGDPIVIHIMGEVTEAPSITVSLDEIDETLEAGTQKNLPLTITNSGAANLEVEPLGNEWLMVTPVTPLTDDNHNYVVVSNESGSTDALFNWIDIHDGTRLTIPEENDNYFTELQLPWEFTYFGKQYNKFYLAFNGWMSFEKWEYQEDFYFGQRNYTPNSEEPNTYIAACWGFIGPIYNETPGSEGLYVKSFDDKVVISFEDYINGFGMGNTMSAQIILYRNGVIKLQYKVSDMDFTAQNMAVSFENEDGTKGEQIAYYDQRIQDKSAFVLTPTVKSNIAAGESQEYNVLVNAATLISGEYESVLKLMNNTPTNPDYQIQATLQVTGDALIETVESIDLGEIVIELVTDEYGDEIYKPYFQEFTVKNIGKALLEINNIEMENSFEMATSAWVYTLINDPWGAYYMWVSSDDPGMVQYPLQLMPGESIKLKAQVNPTEAQSAIADNLIIESSIGETIIPVSAKAILPPALTVDMNGLTVVAKNKAFKESRQFVISNENGQSALNIQTMLSFDRGSVASVENVNSFAPISVNANVKALTMGPVAQLSIDKTKVAASDERKISHSDKVQAENYVGFGGGVEFDAATSFKAPANGFNLTDVETFATLADNKTAEIVVTIMVGKEINASNTLYAQKYTVERGTDADNKGSWKRFKLDQSQIMLPGEVFHVVFSYPEEIKFPQGIVEAGKKAPGTSYYYSTSETRWVDITTIQDFASKVFLTRAVETEFASAAWVELTGETTLSIPAGETAEIQLDFKGLYGNKAENEATLVINSNDPKNREVELPVKMIMNQAPAFETGNTAFFTVNENEELNATINIVDAEGDDFTIEEDADINGMTVTTSSNALIISYKPTFNDAGNHKFTATATDAQGNISECVVNITVLNINRAPIVKATIKDKVYSLREDTDIINFADVFADPDQDEMTYTLISSNDGIVECFVSEKSVIIQPVTIGTTNITMKATDGHGLSITTSFNVEVKNRVGIDELMKAEIKVYPNPAHEHVFVQWSDMIPGDVTVKVTSADGKLMLEKQVDTSSSAGEYQISVSSFSPGVYFIEMISDKESITKRILKK